MKAGEFFVMLNTQGCGYTPLMRDRDEIAQFSTADEAKMCAENNLLGSNFGFEVFERGTGEMPSNAPHDGRAACGESSAEGATSTAVLERGQLRRKK